MGVSFAGILRATPFSRSAALFPFPRGFFTEARLARFAADAFFLTVFLVVRTLRVVAIGEDFLPLSVII
jgi:hypothetical protein